MLVCQRERLSGQKQTVTKQDFKPRKKNKNLSDVIDLTGVNEKTKKLLQKSSEKSVPRPRGALKKKGRKKKKSNNKNERLNGWISHQIEKDMLRRADRMLTLKKGSVVVS